MRYLILAHRYLGIALCLLFAMWFLSAIAMVYARDMPRLTSAVRLEHLPTLDLTRVHRTLDQAAARADLSHASGEASLLTILGRPAYRFDGRTASIVFADTGEALQDGGPALSLEIARRFSGAPLSSLHDLGPVTSVDQWTIGQRRLLPLEKIRVDDQAATELYVSNRTGEVVVETTRRTRLLAWISAIPHWLYFTALRAHDALWRQVVLWASGLGTLSAFIGLVLAWSQYRVRYIGLLRGHYWTGVVFGVFALTWVFSGFLSMEPWFWASSSEAASNIPPGLSGSAIDFAAFPLIDSGRLAAIAQPDTVKQIDFRDLQDDPYDVLRVTGRRPVIVSARTLEVHHDFSQETALTRIRSFEPKMPVAASDILTRYDAYYYDRDGEAPLPVLRVKFADPESTWIYLDLAMSEKVARFTRLERIQRWLYHGLHSLDFPFWYEKRPLWDIIVITLCTGGALLSSIGLALAARRLSR